MRKAFPDPYFQRAAVWCKAVVQGEKHTASEYAQYASGAPVTEHLRYGFPCESGWNHVLYVPCAAVRCEGFLFFSEGDDNVDTIRYNEKHEAFEITFDIWDKPTLVLFFVDDQQVIIDNLSVIAAKLDKISSKKSKLAQMIYDGGWFNHQTYPFIEASELADAMFAAYLSVDIDEGEIFVNIAAAAKDDYFGGILNIEIGDDNGIEILGWDE